MECNNIILEKERHEMKVILQKKIKGCKLTYHALKPRSHPVPLQPLYIAGMRW